MVNHGWLVTKAKGKRNGPKETGGASQPRSILSRDVFVKSCKAGDGLLERIMIAAPKPNLLLPNKVQAFSEQLRATELTIPLLDKLLNSENQLAQLERAS